MNVRLVQKVANQPLGNKNGSIPSPIRRTVIKLLDVADEADLRADMLEWMIDSFPIGDDGPDRVRTLRQGAARLRQTASHMLAPTPEEREPPKAPRRGR